MSIITGRNLQRDRLSQPLHGRANYLSVAPAGAIFDFNPSDAAVSAGVSALDPNLTINGVINPPAFRYKCGDANATNLVAWSYGDTLNLQAGTTPTFNQGSPLLGANDDSVKFNAGGYYQPTSTSLGNLGTDDLVIEAIFKAYPTGNQFIASKDLSGNAGWYIQNNAGTLTFSLHDGVAAVTMTTPVAEAWYHLVIVVDRDENSTSGAAMYLNGIRVKSGNFSTIPNAVSPSYKLTLGGRSDGSMLSNDTLAYIAFWNRASWAAGAGNLAEWDATFAERFHRAAGIWPARAAGTKAPTLYDRGSTGALDKLESGIRKIYHVGDDWPRVVSRTDANSNPVVGQLLEAAKTNLCLQSEDLTTSWSLLTAGDSISANSTAAPDKGLADGLIADTSNGAHGIGQTVTLTATTYTLSVFAKRGDKDFIFFRDASLANTDVWFDLANGTVGTTQSAITAAFIEDWGDGWYRCGASFVGTAAAHGIRIRSAEADNDQVFVGDGATINTYFWGVQLEAGEFMSSYIPTTSSAVTRAKDDEYYKGDDGNLSDRRGRLVIEALIPNYNPSSAHVFVSLSDGGAAADRIELSVNPTGNVLRLLSASTEDGTNVDINGSADLADGALHTYEARWAADNYAAFVDGVSIGTDTTAPNPPNDLDRIRVGGDYAGAAALDGVITRLRIYP